MATGRAGITAISDVGSLNFSREFFSCGLLFSCSSLSGLDFSSLHSNGRRQAFHRQTSSPPLERALRAAGADEKRRAQIEEVLDEAPLKDKPSVVMVTTLLGGWSAVGNKNVSRG